MTFKTLKHKRLPDVYGAIISYKGKNEIGHISVPTLLSQEASLEAIKKSYTTDALLNHQLDSYDLIEVKLVQHDAY